MYDNSILYIAGANVKDSLKTKKIAIIPFGSVEYHGPHAPLGTDSFIAKELCERVAAKLDAITCPLIAYTSCPVSTLKNPGTIHIDQEVMTSYIEAVFRGLFRNGVTGVLALNAHDGNIDTVKQAANRVAFDYPNNFILLVNWWQTLPTSDIEKLGLFSQNGGHGHGGPLETSAVWAVAPESVVLEEGRDIEIVIDPYPMFSVLNAGVRKPDWPGYHGRISESSIKKGRILLEMAEKRIVEIVNNWLRKDIK